MSVTMSKSTKTNPFLSLPAELIPMIACHLEYPDILSLRLVHPHFYYSPLLNTDNDHGIRARVAWLCSVGSFGPLEVLTSQRFSSRFPFRLYLTRQPSLWALVDPLRYVWRPDEISHVCMRLKTDKEFLSNVQIQRMLKLRVNHAACQRGKPCRIASDLACSGPRKSCGRLLSTPGLTLAVQIFLRDTVFAVNQWRAKHSIFGWDMLFLLLVTTGLVMPWSLLLQEIGRCVGIHIGSILANVLVVTIGMVLGKSLFGKSGASFVIA